METVNELDDLDRQLRDAAPYIDDDGFTQHVLATLPPRRARRQPVRAAILFGATLVASLVAYLLSGGGQFVRQGIVRMGHLSPLVLLVVAATIGLLVTAIGLMAALSNNRDLQSSLWSRN